MQDRLTLFVSYVRDAAAFTEVTSSFPDIVPTHNDGVSNRGSPTAISGGLFSIVAHTCVCQCRNGNFHASC